MIFALADCNNFYASCERVFRPALNGKAVVVLSNNDGCIVARSNEAKALGIGMGTPFFKARDIIEKNGVVVFSSNYTLYADMSARVMETLSTFTPEMEIYSIDEAFLNLDGFPEPPADYARKIRNTVAKWTGMPISIGIARTKTLAKIANHLAKKSVKADGVLDLIDSPYLDEALKRTEVGDVWGVGRKTAEKLQKIGIHTALDLKNTDIGWIKKTFGVNGERTVLELRQQSCYELEDQPPAKKGITVSRSFGKEICTLDDLKNATAKYTARAAEKLRNEKQAAGVLTVFAMTNRFNPKTRYYNSHSVTFPSATIDTSAMLTAAMDGVEAVFREGCRFKKAGVMLTGLVDENKVQRTLFESANPKHTKELMTTIDKINRKLACPLIWAAEGLEHPWATNFQHRSKRYTTCWDEIPCVST